ncbi:glycine-rich domain-containing protein [Thioalkalivibrio sp. AKL19]|uniref:glycine-rich domain-containing protein n=1 Tax=Thioalkalivibrio sp. AKL19 TaxID=1266914 RepID=UPI000402C3DA|nr:fibronectin type III domain-containing protein [Thioalkalivibrio sp. AKL19]
MSASPRRSLNALPQVLGLGLKHSPLVLGAVMALVAGAVQADGTCDQDGNTYTCEFTDTGAHALNLSEYLEDDEHTISEIEYLAVGGGGGGGGGNGNAGGGGGAGGFVEGTMAVGPTDTLNLYVGSGGSRGSGSPDNQTDSSAGGDGSASWIESSVERIEAVGGGGGARGFPRSSYTGRYGGSGGGGTRYGSGGSSAGEQGHSGGRGGRTTGGAGAGGGGGAGGAGSSGSNQHGGNGGAGRESEIFEGTYAGGGGGGNYNKARRGSGGRWGTWPSTEGGGTGGHGDNDWSGQNATTNTGSGGGGGGGRTSFWGVSQGTDGGDGGSGVVKVRFEVVDTADTRTTTIEENGQTFVVHQFLNPEMAHEFVVPEGVTEVEYLVLGGGGAAGSAPAGDANSKGTGGGGAGGFLTGSKAVQPGESYTIAVGAGGSVDDSVLAERSDLVGQSGQASVFGVIEAMGGGGGADWSANNGQTGGSGGGGAGRDGTSQGGSGEPGQGFGGGDVTTATGGGEAAGGGGGGAGGPGIRGSINDSGGGDGGQGLLSTITGEARWYAGGGGGGATARLTDGKAPDGGLGGLGGGGAGRGDAEHGQDGEPGVPNTGGGGGGIGREASSGDYTKGGAGGSGIVVVRYALPETVPERPNQGTVSLPELPRIEGGETVHVPVTLEGFDEMAGDKLLAYVRVPEGGGTVSITGTTGLTREHGYDSFTGERTIGFKGSREAVTTALKEHLEWTAPLNRQDVVLEVSVTEASDGVFFNPDNGHYYKPVESSDKNWTDARDAAAGQELFGMTGYLATITSQEENDFIAERVDAEDLWIGASDHRAAIEQACGSNVYTTQGDDFDPEAGDQAEGRWYWVTGPEACTQFWAGDEETGHTVAGRFANWPDTEPNNDHGGEHYAATKWTHSEHSQGPEYWYDFVLGREDVNNYLIEFGGLPGEASEAHFGNGSTTLRSTNGVTVDSLTAAAGGAEQSVGIGLPTAVEEATADLKVGISIAADGGTLTVTTTAGLTQTEGGSFTAQQEIAFHGTADAVRTALENVEWTPGGDVGRYDFELTIEEHDEPSAFLAQGIATLAVAAVPGVPQEVTAEPGNAQATVRWTAADDGASPISHYSVTATNGGDTHTCQTANGQETSCTVTGLSNGTEYTVTVTATNASGTGAESHSVTITPVSNVTVSAPSGATEVVNDDGSVTTSYTNLNGDTVRVTQGADNSASGAITLDGSNGQTSTVQFDGGETDSTINPDGSISSVNTTNGVTTRTRVHPDGRISYCQGVDCSLDDELPPGSTLRVDEGSALIVVEEGQYPDASADADGSLNVCYAHDDFNSGVLTGWKILASQNYTPQVVRIGGDPNNHRLRLTDVGGNRATGITKDVPIPSTGRVELDFVAHIYGGSGADGLAVVLSDWNEAHPSVGAPGGSLGYAQRSGGNGFEDGWLGIGIDSWGNFANSNEGRIGGPGFRRNAVSLRGSAPDYRYLTGTPANLQPKLDGSYNGHRYRVLIDATDSVEGVIRVTVQRATKPDSDEYETLVDEVNVLADEFNQGTLPEQFRLSLTASTGGAHNYHELSSLRVAASTCEAVDPPSITTEAGAEPFEWTQGDDSLVATIDYDGEGELFVSGPDAERFELRNDNELHFREGEPEESGTYEVEVGIQDDRGNRDSETYQVDVDLQEANETPNAPRNLEGFAGVERAALRWDLPDNADDVDLADFTVYGKKGSDAEVEYPVIRSWQQFLTDEDDERTRATVLEEDGPWCRLDDVYEPLGCVVEVDGGMAAEEYTFQVTASNANGMEGEHSESVTVTPVVLDGNGTKADPWQVTDAEEFGLIGTALGGGSDAHYALTGDIGLKDVDWQPIGSAEEPFTGSLKSADGEQVNVSDLDGQPLFDVIGPGAEVSDVNIQKSVNSDAGDYAGLLANAIEGSEDEKAVIRNVTIDNDSSISGGSFVGGLAGTIEHATIDGVTIDANVTGSGNYVGGVGGTIADSDISGVGGTPADNGIEYSTVNGDVAGHDYVGGVGGQIDGSTLTNVKVNGGVQGEGSNVGGVGGQINRSDNANCVLDTIRVDGNVSGGNKTGGVGGGIDGCKVSDVEVNGDVTGGDETGGVGGDINDSEIDNATVKGKVKGNKKTGGIGGSIDESTVKNSELTEEGSVEGTEEVGGIGGAITDSTIEDNTVNGEVTGDQQVDGIGGSESGSTTLTGNTDGATVDETNLGSEANPYLITEWGHLHAIRNNPDAHYQLDADLGTASAGYGDYASDAAHDGKGWQPIPNFTGQLDGNDKTITGLHIDRAGESNIGLFAELGTDAVVKDLTLADVDIVGGDQTGSLAARSWGTIEGVRATGRVEGDLRNTGGLIGLVTGGSVVDASTNVAVVKESTALGNSGGLFGDLVQSGDAIIVENVHAQGDVTTQNGNAGGLIGLIEGEVTVRNASASGTVSGVSHQGGLVGYIWKGGVEASLATGNVSGTSHLGGLVGEVWDGSVVDSYATGAIGDGGSQTVGGLIGSLGGSSTLSRSYASGSVQGSAPIGGLLGSEGGSVTVEHAYFDSTVNSNGMGDAGYGRTSTELATLATFKDDWDIGVSGEVEPGYPRLSWQEAGAGGQTWVIYPFAGGDGTPESPYEIATPEQLALIGDDPTAHYVLMGDIDLDGVDWQPIGSEAEPFTGSLTSSDDGVVRSIKGLDGKPLFDAIGPGAEVADLTIEGSVNDDADGGSGLLANRIAGEEGNPARIDNVTIDDASRIDRGDNDIIGGLAGTIDHAELNHITMDGEVKGRDYVGGIGGQVSNSTISDTTVTGHVEGRDYVGGIGGELDGSTVTDTTVTGDVTGSGDHVGGVGGEVNDSSVDNVAIEGNVEGQDYVGGIGGEVNDSSISGSTVSGDVDGNDHVGGVGGVIANSELDGTHVEGGVTGTGENVGDIAGQIEGEVRIDDEAPGIYDEAGNLLDDQSIATGEPVRFRVPFGDVTPSGTVSRGEDTHDLGTATGPVLLTDPDGGATILRVDDESYYVFQASRGGHYTLQFEDGAYTFSIEFEVRPQVAFSSTRQFGTDGEEVEIRAVLEGTPGQYPVVVPYTLSGVYLIGESEGLETENGGAGLLTEGEFKFEDGEHERIRPLKVTPDATTGIIGITLTQGDGPEHAVLGDPAEHVIELRSAQEIPLSVRVTIEQGTGGAAEEIADGVVQVGEGDVTLSVTPGDAGTYSYDWNGSDPNLGFSGNGGHTIIITDDANGLEQLAGDGHGFQVTVTDGARRGAALGRLRVVETIPDEYQEAIRDRDEAHRLPICPEGTFRRVGAGHCVSSDREVMLATPEGYSVRMGQTSERVSWDAGRFGTGINSDDLHDGGGNLALNRDDPDFEHLGYLVDFEVFDLQHPGQSVPVVIPLADDESIPADATWRKWHGADGWKDFVQDDANRLHSAARSGDACPWPGSDRWEAGLNEGYHCVRLILEDGGPNDLSGNDPNGVIADPGTLAVPAGAGGDEDAKLTSGGGGAFGGWLIVGLAGLLLAARVGRGRGVRRRLSPGAIGGAALLVPGLLLVPMTVQAGGGSDDEVHPWYVGGQLGYARTGGVSSASVTDDMERAGIAGSARVSDRTRGAWRLFGGYHFTEHFGLEGGYTDLGEITTRFRDVDAGLEVDDLEGIRPTSGRGLELVGTARWAVHERIDVFARAGVWHWQARYNLRVGSERERHTVYGTSGVIGAGASWHWNERWSSRLSVDRYRSDGSDHDFFGIGLVRRY